MASSESPRLDAELLLCHCLDKPRTYLVAWPDRLVESAPASQFATLLARRLQGEPVAHLIGEREFWSLPLKVSSATLIPRPDTECLVEAALNIAAETSPKRILDLGTGSGAIAFALASELPQCDVLAIDQSLDALAIAEENKQTLHLQNVTLQQSHWFKALKPQSFEMIVSNPPYIDANDHHLNEGDVRFEPRSALVADNHGYSDLETIIQQAPAFLAPKGWLLLEHGYQQAAHIRTLFQQQGYQHCRTVMDYGQNPRVTLACYPG